MTLKEAENAIVEEFSMYEEWLDKYEYIIELGKALKDYPEEAKTDEKLIKGCQSRVWLDYKVEDGKIFFEMINETEREMAFRTIGVIVSDVNGRLLDIMTSSYSRGARAMPGEKIVFEKELQPYVTEEMTVHAQFEVFGFLMPE